MSERAIKMVLSIGILICLGVAVYFIAGARTPTGNSAVESKQEDNGQAHLERVQVEAFAMSEKRGNRIILDVRTPNEFLAGHLPGAMNIDFYDTDFAHELTKLDPSVPYAVYCRSGNRSGQTLDAMRSIGFTDVLELDGGIVAWEQSGRTLCNKC